jgi:hypothetical protein
MVKYDMNWLKEKGFFEKIIPLKIEDKEVVVDSNNLLAYIEISNNEEVEKIRKELSSSAQKIKYIWFYFPFEEKVKVFRRYGGELPWFWYRPELRKEFLKSREDKLNKFSVKNMDILFDTRDIAERFYWQLWEVRIKLAKNIQDLKEDGNKLLVVQHLLDRLIFFYFLAQLGLVKIKNEEKEWKLDRKRTREFFEWICKTLSEKDLQDFLNKVFFDALGEVREDGWSLEQFKIGAEKFSVIAPSLDGGLFVEEEFEGKHEREIRIKGIKELILEILNKYNWVIGEEVPEEEDVIGDLTPEIIGHIYEKFVVSLEELGKQLKRINLNDIKTVKGELRTGRKKIGAYYTPTEITNYISINTIYPYITDKINKEFKTNYKNIWDEILNKEKLTKKEIEIIKFLYFRILKELKICDNACGSGSFLIAAGNILLRLYSKVIRILEENQSEDEEVKKITLEIRKSPTRNYFIVREIIINNLYGVDIMEGAIEIAKLRFWLWLISQIDPKWVRNKKIETLPNLDFNLVVGNSLIGFVEEKIVADLPSTKKKDKLVWKNLKTRYLSLESFKYQDIIKEKEKIVDEFKLASGEKRKKLKEKIDEIDKPNREYLNKKFYELLKNKNINISWEEFLKLRPFHWSYEFPKVFGTKNPEERGFDIIIGNPPWGDIFSNPEKNILNGVFNSMCYGFNSFTFFTENCIRLLKNTGELGYILPKNLIRSNTYNKIRKIILDNFKIRKLSAVCIGVFVGVTSEAVILIGKKCTNKNERKNNYTFCSSVEFSRFPPSQENKIKQDIFYNLSDFIFNIFLTDIKTNILRIIENKSQRLEIIAHILSGISAGDEKKLTSFVKKNKSWKPVIRGDNISRYAVEYRGEYVLYDKNRLHRARDEDKFLVKEKLVSQHVSNSLKFGYDANQLYCMQTINLLVLKNDFCSIKFLLTVLNSSLMNYYYQSLYNIGAEFTTAISVTNLRKLPIQIPSNQQPFITLCDYMLSLNKTEERRKSEKGLIDFIDKQIIDSLVYELYFKEELKTDLLQLVEPYLKDIENLKSDEEKLKTIKQVTEKIRNDSKVMKEIEKIKSHKWIKIIEGVKNDSQS